MSGVFFTSPTSGPLPCHAIWRRSVSRSHLELEVVLAFLHRRLQGGRSLQAILTGDIRRGLLLHRRRRFAWRGIHEMHGRSDDDAVFCDDHIPANDKRAVLVEFGLVRTSFT